MKVTVKAYAKINLSLDITGKRADGYHTLCSVMQSVSLCDIITVSLGTGLNGKLTLECSDGTICGENNLAFKAAERFFGAAGIIPDVDIYIDKHIPLAGGLGGGSADAAAVLKVLNIVWDEPLTESELLDIALSLGADVPFCLKGGTMLAEGIGEVLTPMKSMPDCLLLIAKKGLKSSTGDMYRALDSAKKLKASDLNGIKEGLSCGNVEKLASGLYNSFETVCGDDSLEVKRIMNEYGAVYAGLSGAGPSVFGIFKTEADRKKAAEALKTIGSEVFSCYPVNFGNEII